MPDRIVEVGSARLRAPERRTIIVTMSGAAKDRVREMYEAYLAVPEGRHAEIIDGTLYVMPRPGPQQRAAASERELPQNRFP